MTERFSETLSTGVVTDNLTGREYKCEYRIDDALLELMNELHAENMNLKVKHTQMIIILKDVVNYLKRMDTYRYAEHLEKIANLHFLSEKELKE